MKEIKLVAALCAALACATLSYTTFAALIPTFSVLWQLSYTQAGIVNGAFIAGYVVAVPMLVGLTDRIDARRILLASLALGAVSAAAFAAWAPPWRCIRPSASSPECWVRWPSGRLST